VLWKESAKSFAVNVRVLTPARYAVRVLASRPNSATTVHIDSATPVSGCGWKLSVRDVVAPHEAAEPERALRRRPGFELSVPHNSWATGSVVALQMKPSDVVIVKATGVERRGRQKPSCVRVKIQVLPIVEHLGFLDERRADRGLPSFRSGKASLSG
jgi:hypothetical protein